MGELLRVSLGGMPCDLQTRGDIEGLVGDALTGTGPVPLLVASANLDRLHRFGAGRPDEGFFDRSRHADRWVVLLDGAPLVAQARRLTGQRWPKLAGSDLLPELLALADGVGARVGFLGGELSTHERLRAELAVRWPRLSVAGTWAPTAEEVTRDDPSVPLRIRDAGTDMLIVALTPQSEHWLDRWAEPSGLRVGAAFGAAADFLVGTQRRAPRLAQRLGIEWLWRLAHEPRRLARRYIIEGPASYWQLRRHSSLDA